MSKRNRFHFVVDVNRRFLANGTVIAGDTRTDVITNVDEDKSVQEAVTMVLLLAVHNLILEDRYKQRIQEILDTYGLDHPSAIKASQTTTEQAMKEMIEDDPDDY